MGSPFTFVLPPPTTVQAARYPRHEGALGGAIAACVLGIFSLVVGAVTSVPAVGLFLAALGFLMGSWGLFGQRRAAAYIGIGLCGSALCVCGFRTALQLHRMIYG
jgi:hypothetical protein